MPQVSYRIVFRECLVGFFFFFFKPAESTQVLLSLADRAQGKQGRLLQLWDPECPSLSHTKLQALEKTEGLSHRVPSS